MAEILFVTEKPEKWKVEIPLVRFVRARDYLENPEFIALQKGTRVFNLCSSYRYQSIGYYVSLLAEARSHKVAPSVSALQDLKAPAIIRLLGEDLENLMQRVIGQQDENAFVLSIYFGRNVESDYDKLAASLFDIFHIPLLRAYFKNSKGRWYLSNIDPIAAKDVPPDHWPSVQEFAKDYFACNKFPAGVKKPSGKYDLAILVDDTDKPPPSDKTAIERFQKAAEKVGFEVEIIGRDDFSRLNEFDALFIRATTSVNHYTYRFAQRAAAEGLVVMDDPVSILRCSNKVYLAEILKRHKIPMPKTAIVSRETAAQAVEQIGLPCILKLPDSAFSKGVIKVKDVNEYRIQIEKFFASSDLVVVQEFLPTEFDWRIGVLDKEPLYVCKYYMARKHWQIVNWENHSGNRYGKFESLVPELAPPAVMKAAVKAAGLIGDGLYGVDVKQIGQDTYVIEINDNPSIDSAVEDKLLKSKLYETVMKSFHRRVKAAKETSARH